MRSQLTRDDRIAALEAECAKLRAENEALRAIVHGEKSGRTAGGRAETTQLHAAETSVRHDSPTADKVALFRSMFRGREDVYPVRWESKAGRSGYSPACGNEWLPGICEKPRIKCADCPNRAFIAVSDDAVYEHLFGRRILGVYPILHDDTTWFVAADFDGSSWRDDAMAYASSCRELGIPPASRSRVLAKARTYGPSLIPRSRRATPGRLPARPSLVHARGIAPSPLRPMTVSSHAILTRFRAV